MASTFNKDPDELLDYEWDFSLQLAEDGSDTITGTPTITVPTGITLENQSNTTTTITAWLSGGTAGQRYEVECDMSTVGGRTYSRTILILVRDL